MEITVGCPIHKYTHSRLPITRRTFKGNRKKFELRKSDNRKQETNSLYRTVNVTFTLVEMLSENERYFYFINVTPNVTKYSPNMFRTFPDLSAQKHCSSYRG